MKRLALITGITILSLIAILGLINVFVVLNTADKPVDNAKPSVLKQETVTPPTVDELFRLVNEERAKVGVQPLTINSLLNQSAQNKSNDMVANNYYDHVNPNTGVTGWKTIPYQELGCTYASENLNAGVSDKNLIKKWLNSQPHKEAILDPRYDLTGFGITKMNNYYYAVQHFCDL